MSAHPRPRVLVVEDEWVIADQIASALELAGYDVLGPVGRVDQALALMKGATVDAAVLDINLHEDRSFRLAQRLTEQDIPFAFLSGYSRSELPAELKGTPLMQKPVNAGAIGRCVASLLANAKT